MLDQNGRDRPISLSYTKWSQRRTLQPRVRIPACVEAEPEFRLSFSQTKPQTHVASAANRGYGLHWHIYAYKVISTDPTAAYKLTELFPDNYSILWYVHVIELTHLFHDKQLEQ